MALPQGTKPAAAKALACEAGRLQLLLERDGEAATRDWVKRTYTIYRSAVLDPGHFASSGHYRRQFLASCADFRRWLRAHPA